MADDTLTSTLTDSQAAQALPVSQPQIPQQAPDLPRFQRTFGNTLKSMLIGLGEGGVLGAAFGAANPAAIERQQQQRQQAIKTQQDFESARAAGEAARAVSARKQADAFDEQTKDLHDQREARLLDQAKTLGLSVVGVVDTNQGTAQNNQNASAALKNIQAQNNGQYPEGIVPFHLADKTILMKATDPTAGLDLYNSVQRAKGEPPVSPDQFKAIPQAAKNEAIEYFRPKNAQGVMDASTLSIAQQRLATAQAQGPYPEQSQHVKDLTQEVDLQQRALQQSNKLAQSQAQAAGQAEVAKSAVTAPAATKQEVARQTALAGTPQEVEKRKLTESEVLKNLAAAHKDESETGMRPIFAFDPATKQQVLTTPGEARAKNYTNPVPVKEGDIEKATQENRIGGEIAAAAARYDAAVRALPDNADRGRMALALDGPGFKDVLSHGVIGIQLPYADAIDRVQKGNDYKRLPPQERRAVDDYVFLQSTMPAYLRMQTGSARMTEAQLKLEMGQLADPSQPLAKVLERNKLFGKNLDIRMQGIPRIPNVQSPQETRARVQAEEAQAPGNLSEAEQRAAEAQQKPKPAQGGPAGAFGRNTRKSNLERLLDQLEGK
jgi:hypothetical protein